MRGGPATLARGLGASAVTRLSLGAQHALEARLTGDVHPLVGQHGHDACWRHVRKARLVGHAQQLRALNFGQCVGGHGAHSLRSPIARVEALMGSPALQGTSSDARDLAGLVQTRSRLAGGLDVAGMFLAILQVDHSSSSRRFLCKIASHFFESTSSAAVSVRALSLRRTSRSSSLMRR